MKSQFYSVAVLHAMPPALASGGGNSDISE
jgi:hypothetical protein